MCVIGGGLGGAGEAAEIAALAITREEIPHEETITCEHKFNQHTMETCQETRQSAEGASSASLHL